MPFFVRVKSNTRDILLSAVAAIVGVVNIKRSFGSAAVLFAIEITYQIKRIAIDIGRKSYLYSPRLSRSLPPRFHIDSFLCNKCQIQDTLKRQHMMPQLTLGTLQSTESTILINLSHAITYNVQCD